MPLEQRQIDLTEQQKVSTFIAAGCGCNQACSAQLTEDHYNTVRANCAELTWDELNMSIMGQLMALTYCQPTTINSTRHRHNPKKRERNTTAFQHHGLHICQKTFLFLHGIGEYCLKAIKARYLSEGLLPRVHGHKGRIPPNALLLEEVRELVKFIQEYAEANAILLPGRVPGYKRDDIQLLPSSTTKRAVWRLYIEAADTLTLRAVGYSTFCRVWKKLLPHVVVCRPLSDLCWTCQQNSTAIVRSVNLCEEEKSEVRTCVCTTRVGTK